MYTCMYIYMLSVYADKKGRDTQYLSKLLLGTDYFMGDKGTYFTQGVTFNLCCFCKCRWFTFHFPQGLLEDFYYYVSNNHGFFSVISAERGHPFRRIERNFSFMALGSLTFFGVVGASFYGTSNTNTIIFQVALGLSNFFLTNLFQVLFACTCLFGSGGTVVEKRNLLIKCFETSGTVLGCLLAVILSVGMLLGASVLCGDGGVALVSFVIRSQIPSIGIGLGMMYIHFIPYVLHLSHVPFLGDMTLMGSWYLDKYEASNALGEEWAQEGSEESGTGESRPRNLIQRTDFRFLEINFYQYCIPGIPYFTTDAEFDPDAKKKKVATADTGAAAAAAKAESGGRVSTNQNKVHPSTSTDPVITKNTNTNKQDHIEFNDIEKAEE